MVAQGLPVLRDGRLSRAQAKAWMRDNLDPARSGLALRLAGELPAPREPAGAVRAALASRAARLSREGMVARDMMRTALEEVDGVAANLVLDAGGSIKLAYAVAAMIGPCLSWQLGSYAQARGWVGPDENILRGHEPAEVDWPALAAAAGEAFDEAECEAYADERWRLQEEAHERSDAEAAAELAAGREPEPA